MKTDDRGAALVAIGGRIRQRRRELQITQGALAEKAGLSKSFISEIEGGQASAAGLMYLKVAEALEVSVEWLLTGETPERPIVRPSDVEIPPFVAEVAEEQQWSYGETLDVAAALETFLARRTRGRRLQPTREDLITLVEALRRLQPNAPKQDARKKPR